MRIKIRKKGGRCGRVEAAGDNNGLLTRGREQTGSKARESGSRRTRRRERRRKKRETPEDEVLVSV